MSKEVSPTAAGVASQTDGMSKAVDEISSLQTDDGNVTKLDSENLSETVKDSHQIVLSEADKGAALRRRRRKPSTVLRPEEDELMLETGDRYSHEGSPVRNEEKRDLALTSEKGNSSRLSNSSRKKIDFSEVSPAKNGQPKKKKSMINQHKDLEFSSTLKKKILKLKERGYDAPKKTVKRVIAGSGKTRVEKEGGGVIGDTSKEEKHQLSHQELSGRKEIISHKYVPKDAAQKVIKFFFCLKDFARTSVLNCFGIIYADGGFS